MYVEEDTLVDMDRTQICKGRFGTIRVSASSVMLNSELRSMFTENFTEDQRRQFFPPDGRPFMKIHEALMGGGEVGLLEPLLAEALVRTYRRA